MLNAVLAEWAEAVDLAGMQPFCSCRFAGDRDSSVTRTLILGGPPLHATELFNGCWCSVGWFCLPEGTTGPGV